MFPTMKVALLLLVAFSLATPSAGFAIQLPDRLGLDPTVSDKIEGESEDVSDFYIDSSVDTSECSTYKILNESKRAQGNAGAFMTYNERGWYRLQGEAGTAQIANSCPKRSQCGWMVGEHPTVEQGVVRRKACSHWSKSCCFLTANIRVRNCGSFYVYEFRTELDYSWKFQWYCGNGQTDQRENSGESGSGVTTDNSGEGSSPA